MGIAKQALNYLKRGLGSYLKDDKREFEEWQKRNPSKSFKDFFSETVEAKLRAGETHKSLGGKFSGKVYGEVGQGFFRKIVKLGLKPEDSLVDYGCGTLRMGIHAINYLQPGKYWGLEISDFLLQQGRELVGDALLKEKQPRLEVISPASVAAAAAAKPAMLISIRVLIHVHPDELPEYFGNVMTIIGSSGQAVINGKWSRDGTIQSSNRSWAHDVSILERIVKAEGGTMKILTQEECELEGINERAISGTLRIVRDHAGPQH
jgi:hypothetical protein